MVKHLCVKQQFKPIGNSIWDTPPFEATVWEYTGGGDPELRHVDIPDGYAPGLLVAYIDEKRADLIAFEKALLETLNLTRTDVEVWLRRG